MSLLFGEGDIKVRVSEPPVTAAKPQVRSGVAEPASLDAVRLAWACTQALLRERSWRAAAAALVSELARILGCERISMGWMERMHVRVMALSHGAQVTRHPALDELTAAMHEAISQAASLNLSQKSENAATVHMVRAHKALLRRQGLSAVLSVPIADGADVVAVITCEKASGQFSPEQAHLLEQVMGAVTPLLLMRRQLDLPWTKRLSRKLRKLRSQMADPHYSWVRWLVVLAVLGLAAILAVPVPHRVSANARLEGSIQRIMTAPQDGFLKQVFVRPGDMVKAGQPLALMSDDDLQFTKRSRQAALAQSENAFADAFARGDRSQAAIEQARAAEARAELALVEQQIARTQIAAPFDGVVIQGDLTHQLGAPLKRGETLVTLSPNSDYRVILEVDESDIRLLAIDQKARLLLSSMPGQPLELSIKRITPVARTIDGSLRYEVQADPVDAGAAAAMGLRPGLQGVGKVELKWKPLAWRGLSYVWRQLRWLAWVWF